MFLREGQRGTRVFIFLLVTERGGLMPVSRVVGEITLPPPAFLRLPIIQRYRLCCGCGECSCDPFVL